MGLSRGKDYYCAVISEDVKIILKTKRTMSNTVDKKLYVQCDQSECQYVDSNQSPCPLELQLFDDEIKKREENRR